jgi:hydrogenase maturation protease
MILIIGYGNPLRTDDAIGQHIAGMMEERLKYEAAQVITAYQLTPELVEPIRYAHLVIFIDARVGSTPGKITWENVDPQPGAGAFTHNVTPSSLLDATHELYGVKPASILISIMGADFEYGNDLSPELNRMLTNIADQIETIIQTNLIMQLI